MILNEIIIRKLTEHLNALVGECIDQSGKPKAPSIRGIIDARACLPAGYQHTLVREKGLTQPTKESAGSSR